MKYLHLFDTVAEYNEARSSSYEEPWVSLTEANDEVNYNKTEDEKLIETPFTIKALGSGNISWSLGTKTLQYSKNGGAWATMDSATTIPVVAGDEVQFKGTNANYGNTISSTAQFNAKGNIMSLTDGDNFETANTVGNNAFQSLFSNCTSLVSAEKLKLPATTLAQNCYYCMFYGCTSLTKAPELPATTLAIQCYAAMFNGCTSLATAPELPATALTSSCYSSMFYGCTSLTTAPELPATALTSSCYSFMFSGCTSLTTAPELPATALTGGCYSNMFRGCTNLNYIKAMFITEPLTTYTQNWVNGVASTGTFVKNSAAAWDVRGANGIPTNWTVETATS